MEMSLWSQRMWIMKHSRTTHSWPAMASSATHRTKKSLPSEVKEVVVSFLPWEHTDAIYQELQIFPCKAAFQSAYNWYKRLFQPRCKTWHCAFIEFHKASFFSFLQLGNMFLNSSTSLWCISHSSEFCISSKLAEYSSVSHHWDQKQRCSTHQDTTETLHVYY